jgi:hypothetical protein
MKVVIMHRAISASVLLVRLRVASCSIFSLCLLIACLTKIPEVQAAELELDQQTLAWIQRVLDSWERTCRRDLHVSAEPLPWIIFYDDIQAWHLKPDERMLPPHKVSSLSLRFAGRTHTLIPLAHQGDRLWVPGREAIKIVLAKPRAVAMPYDNDQKSFFIAPLPALYHRLAGADQASNLDELFLGLASSQKRKERFFVGDKGGYSDLEDIFLAMEGMAMWVQYRTARERAQAGEDWLKTLIKVLERTGAWSQEEGLGLFLMIDRLVPDWQKRYLAPDFPSPFAVLREAIGKGAARKSAAVLRKE